MINNIFENYICEKCKSKLHKCDVKFCMQTDGITTSQLAKCNCHRSQLYYNKYNGFSVRFFKSGLYFKYVNDGKGNGTIYYNNYSFIKNKLTVGNIDICNDDYTEEFEILEMLK